MFEEQDQENAASLKPKRPRPPQPNPQKGLKPESGAPVNLPTLDNNKPGEEEAEDIFSGPEAGNDQEELEKISLEPGNLEKGLMPPKDQNSDFNQKPPLPKVAKEQSGFKQRKAIVFLLGAFILALVFLIIFLVYKIFTGREKVIVYNTPLEEEEIVKEEEIIPAEQEQEQNQDQESALEKESKEQETIPIEENQENKTEDQKQEKEPEFEQAEPEPEPQELEDTDKDGLTDLKELEIGTNPRAVDTDLDGLDDYAEYNVYGSDPVRRDTDEDGYDDGLEVENGYNPVGSGKL